MNGSRSERARAGTISFGSNRILTADGEMQRLRQLSMKYIREAERLEREHANEREDSEQISAALDVIARDFFARALQNELKE